MGRVFRPANPGRVLGAVIIIVCTGVVGCGHGDDPDVTPARGQQDPDALFQEWKALMDNPGGLQDDARCQMLAAMLASQAPNRLHDMVDLLTDPATKPESKLVILFSLEGAPLPPEIVSRLFELTETNVDGTVRSGVTLLLAQSDDPAVEARLRKLQSDKDQRVRLAALNALTLRDDDEARAQLREMYFEENTPAPFKERIALTLGTVPRKEDADVLSDAAVLPILGSDTRARVVSALAMLQDPETLPVLRLCAEGDYPEDVKAIARDAVVAIEERHQETVADGERGEPPSADETSP